MSTFVGAEYLIANLIIATATKNGSSDVSMSHLEDFGIEVQKRCIADDIDAVLLMSKSGVVEALYDFSDYFTWNNAEDKLLIKKNDTITIDALKARFMGFLPSSVLKVIIELAEKVA